MFHYIIIPFFRRIHYQKVPIQYASLKTRPYSVPNNRTLKKRDEFNLLNQKELLLPQRRRSLWSYFQRDPAGRRRRILRRCSDDWHPTNKAQQEKKASQCTGRQNDLRSGETICLISPGNTRVSSELHDRPLRRLVLGERLRELTEFFLCIRSKWFAMGGVSLYLRNYIFTLVHSSNDFCLYIAPYFYL